MNLNEPITVTALKVYCTSCCKEFIVPTSAVPHNTNVGSSFRWNEMCSGCWERGRKRTVIDRLEFDGSTQPRSTYLVVTPVMVFEPDEAPMLDSFRVEAASMDEAAARAVAIIGTEGWWERVCGSDVAASAVYGQFFVLTNPLNGMAAAPLIGVRHGLPLSVNGK
jgi:hypothetical protein